MPRRLVILLLAGLVGACGSPAPSGAPSLNDAEQQLAKLFALAKAGAFTQLCAIGDGNCQRTLDDVGVTSAPTSSPVILSTRLISPSGNSMGGRVLEVCGTDGSGHTYRSEILVFWDGASLRTINPVFWSGTKIADDDRTAASPISSPGVCPG